MLNWAGTKITRAPRFAMARNSSGKRMSKQIAAPILPQGVSNTVISSPGLKVSDSRKRMPGASMSNRCTFRWRATCRPSLSKTKQVL